MTGRVLDGFFTHEHNRREAAKQEYVLAKQHFAEVLENRVVGIPEHEERFRDAAERQNVARDLFVKFLTR